MSANGISEKVVVITGASSGFGRGVALALAEAGAGVVLAARRDLLLDELAHQCLAKGGRALAVPTDVARHREMEQLAQAAIDGFGRFDVWINDAGVAALGAFDEVPLGDHTRVILTNLLGAINGSWLAMRHFRARGQGTLINVASALGKMPAPYYGSYVASKFGIVGLGGALRQELALQGQQGIRVCTVLPMSHDTPIFDHVANYTRHEVQPIPPLYDAQQVVDTIIRLVTHPEDEVIVGGVGKIMSAAHAVMRDGMETVLAKNSHRAMIENSPPALDSRGNLTDPVEKGSGVRGGRLP